MPFDRSITLKDIASKAGVSIMTVSRALRNQPTSASATRQRIQQIAERLGYRPNPLVSALMSYRRSARPAHKSVTIGFVTNFATRNGWRNLKINRDFFNGAAASADRHGYKLEEFWLREPKMTARRLSTVLYSRNVGGLIIAPLPVALGHIRLDWDKFSAVALGYSLARPQLHRAVNHQFRSMRLAMRRLRKLGYRRIGLALRASIDERVDHHWVGSFLVEQRRSPDPHRVPLLVVPDREWREESFRTWFKEYRPTVVISQHEEILDWLQKMDVCVPEEVGFVHLNCPDESGRFAGIYQNAPTVGAVAVDFLVGVIHRNERGVPDLPHSILVEGTWRDGATLAGDHSLQTEPHAEYV
jgi:DNA-binding LacI/PurR family transcriptional regulator